MTDTTTTDTTASTDTPPDSKDTTVSSETLEQVKAEARKWEARAKENFEARKRLNEIEEAQKTAEQKAADALAAAQAQAAAAQQAALKLNVAISAAPDGMTPQQVADLAGRLSGATEEELAADAKTFFAQFATPEPPKRGGQSLPSPALRLGATPSDTDTDSDPLLASLRSKLNI